MGNSGSIRRTAPVGVVQTRPRTSNAVVALPGNVGAPTYIIGAKGVGACRSRAWVRTGRD